MATRKKKIEIATERTEICRECRAVCVVRAQGMRCHRHAPTFIYDPATGLTNAEWPEVNPDDWCLDFLPNLSS